MERVKNLENMDTNPVKEHPSGVESWAVAQFLYRGLDIKQTDLRSTYPRNGCLSLSQPTNLGGRHNTNFFPRTLLQVCYIEGSI